MTVAEIVRAAVSLADRDGLAGVSMREVAGRLGCSPMTLYNYVATRDDLVTLMVDDVLKSIEPPPPGPWRRRVEGLAHAVRALYLAHPWVVDADWMRSGLGPGELALSEHFVAATSESGLDAKEAGLLWLALTSFIRGSARATIEARRLEDTSGVRDPEWWAAAWAAFSRIAGDIAQRYPALARVKSAGGFDGDEAGYLEAESLRTFEFGLARLLDGVEGYHA